MLLFSAPLDFDFRVQQEYVKQFGAFPVTDGKFPSLVAGEEEVTVWVCNPKADRVIDDSELQYYPNLKILATPSTGTNHIDLKACAARGIKVLSLLDDRAGLETISASAEYTFKLLLDALRKPPARELQGKIVGLVGFGRIGMKLHRWLRAFGASVWAYDPRQLQTATLLKDIFRDSDAVIICCALTNETRGMITPELVRSMKHGAALINTARGEIVDEYGLAMVMEERPDLRVAVDVLEGEVTGTQNPQRLISRGAIVTPHIAGETFDSRTKAARIILQLLQKEMEHGKENTGDGIDDAAANGDADTDLPLHRASVA